MKASGTESVPCGTSIASFNSAYLTGAVAQELIIKAKKINNKEDNIRFVDMGNDQYLKFKWGDSNAGGIRFYDGDDTHHGYIYGDGSGGFGLLDKDSQWFLYTNGSSSTQLRCDNSVKIQLTTIYTHLLPK